MNDGGSVLGISLRDYFAAHAECISDDYLGEHVAAMLGIEELSKTASSRESFLWWKKADALWKYAEADAMLKAREEK